MEDNISTIMKVCFLGSSHVGKTSIINRYCNNTFNDSIEPILGADFIVTKVNVNDITFKLQIWDNSNINQGRFSHLNPIFIRGSMIVIIVFDICDKNTFKELSKYIQYTKDYTSEYTEIILVGNKLDLKEKRVISEEEGQQLANKYNIPYYETSAKSNINIHDMFSQSIQRVIPNIHLMSQSTVRLGHTEVQYTSGGICGSDSC